ncbi:hypothetical protein [Streptomyces aidingensis]|uniref:Uncharacterized protein n=1 Tax=Streptomyces aidingensis TaxID=910347 RepID=A0A1I1V602_9ACTN|nr:hypothetical protein [Streptomyces aidingensis]SFD78245.1 hypothetical protein SAMN05421773_13024 [Streptomyces aidingensis]
MTDPKGVCAQLATDLHPGIPYVRGWSESKRAAELLAEALQALGLAHDFPALHADVNIHGEGIIRLGPIRPETAQLLAMLLGTGILTDRPSAQEWERPTT